VQAGEVKITRYTPNEVLLHVSLTQPGYIVLLDRFDPNWQAAIDGREVTVLRGNHIFRAVQAPGGEHEVRFHYVQRGLRSGALISLATLAFLAIAYFRR
jgi:uncharacterized membrane protein YfhO